MKMNYIIENRILQVLVVLGVMFSTIGISNSALAASAHRLGVGAHYWVTVDDIDVNDVDEKGYSLIFSYQNVRNDYFKFEADLGLQENGYAGANSTVWSPQAFLLIGKGLYGGAGIGINYSEDEFADNPFYALRVGFEMEVLPRLFLDLNANYRFEQWDFDRIKEDVDSDTVTLGAVLRVQF